MPISDMKPNTSAAPTDAICAAQMQQILIRGVRVARQLVNRATGVTVACPGGKAGVNTELSTTQTEASAILDKLVALVNAHKATNTADVTNPLL